MRIVTFCLFLTFLSSVLQAQVCTGTLGANIFQEGSFGEGTANLLSPNPGIAPGYNYTFNVPPFDGQYVITNNTGSWPSLFNTWLSIGDNSLNPNGYMMVVNASNAPGLFYEQTVSGLCSNTLYEFSADIINLIKVGTPNHLDPDVSFLIDGVELFSTGNIAKSNDWKSYGFTFNTNAGDLQSLTLSLRNNAPGGNGNDLALDNISFRACGPEAKILPDVPIINLCENDSPSILIAELIGSQLDSPAFQWQQSIDGGITWINIDGANEAFYAVSPSTGGMFHYRYLVANSATNLGSDKCRVNSVSKIINVLQKEIFQTDTICNGFSFMVGNSVYTETGVYVDSFVNILGCDSILITDLTIESNFTVDYLVSPPCPNLADGSIMINDINGGIPPYNFTLDGVNVGGAGLFTGLEGDKSYEIKIEDSNGCITELSIFIENPPILSLNIGDNQIVDLGESIDLSPQYNFNVANFIWQTMPPIDCQDFMDCDQINFVPSISQNVVLQLFNESGCSISDSLFISVNKVRKVQFPNVFSPNNDGANDYFTVYGSNSNIKLVEKFTVFDRWGNLVFLKNNFLPNIANDGWNGKMNEVPSREGVYVYFASIRFVDDEVLNYTGDFLLIR